MRYATKSEGQREDEEAERLVRPLPKQKPPRYDRRRQQVDVDKDKDMSDKDKDMSMNYKSIGGSESGGPEENTSERRRFTEVERRLSNQLLARNFPAKLAKKLSSLHPDDVQTLVRNYLDFKTLGGLKVSSVEKALEKVGQLHFDPSNIVAPKEGVDPMVVLAAQLATRSRAIGSLRNSGRLSLRVATTLVDFAMLVPRSDLEKRSEKAFQVAKELFVRESSEVEPQVDERFGSYSSWASPTPPSVNRSVLLRSLSDPDLKTLLIASYQGEDYRKVVSSYFGEGSKNRISERESVSSILAKVSSAEELFERNAEQYPYELRSQLDDPFQLFKLRLMQAMEGLNPEKARLVARGLVLLDMKKYKVERKAYEKALREYEVKHAAWKSAWQIGPEPLEPKKPQPPAEYSLVKPPDKGEVQSRLKQVTGKQGYSSYPPERWYMKPSRTAIYHGVEPYSKGREGFEPYVEWHQAHIRDLKAHDYDVILANAREWLESFEVKAGLEDINLRQALDLAIRDVDSGKYARGIDTRDYDMLLGRLKTASGRVSSPQGSQKQAEGSMTTKIATEDANRFLSYLDKWAKTLQDGFDKLSFEQAKEMVNEMDRTADEIELAAFGAESLRKRQIEVLKSANVLQKDSDEGYMDTFNAPMAPVQTDADEGYMSLFKDDQSEAVATGKSSTGRPLAP